MPRIPVYTQQSNTPYQQPLMGQSVETPDYVGRGLSALGQGIGDIAESRFKTEMTQEREKLRLAAEAAEELKREKQKSDQLAAEEKLSRRNVAIAEASRATVDPDELPTNIVKAMTDFDSAALPELNAEQQQYYRLRAAQSYDSHLIPAIQAKHAAELKNREVQYATIAENSRRLLAGATYEDVAKAGATAGQQALDLARTLPLSPDMQEAAANSELRRTGLVAVDRQIAVDPRRALADIEGGKNPWLAKLTGDDINQVREQAASAVVRLNEIDNKRLKLQDEAAKQFIGNFARIGEAEAKITDEQYAEANQVASNIADPVEREKALATVSAVGIVQLARDQFSVLPLTTLQDFKEADAVRVFPTWEKMTKPQQQQMMEAAKKAADNLLKDPAAGADAYLEQDEAFAVGLPGDKYQQRLAVQSVRGVPGDKQKLLTQREVDIHANAFSAAKNKSTGDAVAYLNELYATEGEHSARIVQELAERSDVFPKWIAPLIDGQNGYINQTYLGYMLSPAEPMAGTKATEAAKVRERISKKLQPLYDSFNPRNPAGDQQQRTLAGMVEAIAPTIYAKEGVDGADTFAKFMLKDYTVANVAPGKTLRVAKAQGIEAADVSNEVRRSLPQLLANRDIRVIYPDRGITNRDQYINWVQREVFVMAADDDYVVPCIIGDGNVPAPLEERVNGKRVAVKIPVVEIKRLRDERKALPAPARPPISFH